MRSIVCSMPELCVPQVCEYARACMRKAHVVVATIELLR